ncbi:histidine phosphatase family protein [Halalkalibacillus sediminis]|uniref:Histidine phosphatase family protein n=1 Tax=Halalkalibacillus sediminis TaxID=2018042 RepID=A0A2I0QR81_9BACI|nr:histidine phosphatase family protein [Halalkalibacillus sediminis]PKR76855.1 histidine phosphatase family protein [Halalkalibacillus sediminis]
MPKHIYIVRHSKAEGQAPEAELTELGKQQSEALVNFFSERKIDRFVSSPFIRAVGTIKPLSDARNLPIDIDPRLAERMLSTTHMPDWKEKLKDTFDDVDLKFEGGESTREASTRAVAVIEEILEGDSENTVIVSHGGIIPLLINHYSRDEGFDRWRGLTNPDVYLLTAENGETTVERIWDQA